MSLYFCWMKIQEAIDLIYFKSENILIEVQKYLRVTDKVFFLILTDSFISGFEYKTKVIKIEVTKTLMDYVVQCKEMPDAGKAASKLYAYLLINGRIIDGADPVK